MRTQPREDELAYARDIERRQGLAPNSIELFARYSGSHHDCIYVAATGYDDRADEYDYEGSDDFGFDVALDNLAVSLGLMTADEADALRNPVEPVEATEDGRAAA